MGLQGGYNRSGKAQGTAGFVCSYIIIIDIDGMTMAFLTLSMVEMFHSFNMRSRRESIFKLKSQNIWLWGSFVVSLILTYIAIETPLSQAFGFAEIGVKEYAIAMGLAFAIIPLMEIYKAIMRAIEKQH